VKTYKLFSYSNDDINVRRSSSIGSGICV